jgi:glutathione synthase/RimK-type ligase-like ATP-grasp enzyme
MILIVSYEDNDHVDAVRKHLTTDSVLVDTGWFPSSLGLDARFTRDWESMHFSLPDGKKIDLCDIGAVWYRRISQLGVHEEVTDGTARLFAWSESNEALLGVWYSINCFWMNPPTADEISQRKIRQLQVARNVGLSIPDTVITNEPDVAMEFIHHFGLGNVIRKAFRNIEQAPRETHVIREEDLALIDSVKYAPVIFQRFIPASLDLRVTIVEDDIFAAEIQSQPEYHADYRLGLGSATVKPYKLPVDVETSLFELMMELNIHYGAIDLRVTPEGEHVFLEVNPAGLFLFISERTGQPIPEAIAASLQRHDEKW